MKIRNIGKLSDHLKSVSTLKILLIHSFTHLYKYLLSTTYVSQYGYGDEQINVLPKCLFPNPLNLWICYFTSSRSIKEADGIMVANHLLKVGRLSWLTRFILITNVLKSKWVRQKKRSEWEVNPPAEAGKGKVSTILWSLQKGVQSLPMLWFSPARPLSATRPTELKGNKCVLATKCVIICYTIIKH